MAPRNDMNAPAIAFLSLSIAFLLLLVAIWCRYLIWWNRKGRGKAKQGGLQVEAVGGKAGPEAPPPTTTTTTRDGHPQLFQVPPPSPQLRHQQRPSSRRKRSPVAGVDRGQIPRSERRRSMQPEVVVVRGGRVLGKGYPECGPRQDERRGGSGELRRGRRGDEGRFETMADGRAETARGNGRRVSYAGRNSEDELARDGRRGQRGEWERRGDSEVGIREGWWGGRGRWEERGDSEAGRRDGGFEPSGQWGRHGGSSVHSRFKGDRDRDREKEQQQWSRGHRSPVEDLRPEIRREDEWGYQRSETSSMDPGRGSQESREHGERVDGSVQEIPRTYGGSDRDSSRRGDDEFGGPFYGPHREDSPQTRRNNET